MYHHPTSKTNFHQPFDQLELENKGTDDTFRLQKNINSNNFLDNCYVNPIFIFLKPNFIEISMKMVNIL